MSDKGQGWAWSELSALARRVDLNARGLLRARRVGAGPGAKQRDFPVSGGSVCEWLHGVELARWCTGRIASTQPNTNQLSFLTS